MIERVKTVVLLLLVFASVVLTWQLWTFQPEYDYVLPTQFVTHEGLAERQEIQDLVRPQKVIYHYDEERTTVSYPGLVSEIYLFPQMSEWTFGHFEEVDDREFAGIQERMLMTEGMELQFGTGIPAAMLNEMITLETGLLTLPPINRLWMYLNEDSQGVTAVFISEKEQQMFRAQMEMGTEQFQLQMNRGKSQAAHQPYVFKETQEGEVYPVHHLPAEETALTEYMYFYQRIPLNVMISYLFVDPTLVRQIEDREEGTFYTDGTRGLQYRQEDQTIHFFHPQGEPAARVPETAGDSIQRSIQFVNQHRGWDTDYVLDRVQESLLDRHLQVGYRQLQVDNNIYYPIYSQSSEQEQNVLRLEVQGDRVVGYYRSLVQTDQIMETGSERSLPSGPQLVEFLEEEEVPLDEIEQMRIGYKSEMSDTYIRHIPYWIIEFTDGERRFIRKVPETGGSAE